MHSLLLNMNNAVYKAKESNKEQLSSAQIEKYIKNYEKIIQGAFHYYPPPDRTTKTGKNLNKQRVKTYWIDCQNIKMNT